jgi:hypothetical protein
MSSTVGLTGCDRLRAAWARSNRLGRPGALTPVSPAAVSECLVATSRANCRTVNTDRTERGARVTTSARTAASLASMRSNRASSSLCANCEAQLPNSIPRSDRICTTSSSRGSPSTARVPADCTIQFTLRSASADRRKCSARGDRYRFAWHTNSTENVFSTLTRDRQTSNPGHPRCEATRALQRPTAPSARWVARRTRTIGAVKWRRRDLDGQFDPARG